MVCCLCGGEIEKKYTPDGEMYWDQGHNPSPVKDGPDDRCCDTCNDFVVLPARMQAFSCRSVKGEDLSGA